MSEEYGLVHAKRKHHHGRGNQNANAGKGGAFFTQGGNGDQRNGKFSFDTIHGLKLKEVEYTVPSPEERKAKRAEFQGAPGQEGVRSKFIKMLVAEHEKELVDKLGLTDRDLQGMREGYVPNGFNVHHKLALHGGGKNEFKNFILTPLYPHDQWHHDVMDHQIAGMQTGDSRKIVIPWTDEMIYDPKKYGFTKENQPVQPNYTSKVNPANYPKLYKAEDISVAKRAKDMAPFYAELDARKAAAIKAARGGRS